MQTKYNEIRFMQAECLHDSQLIFDGVILQLYFNHIRLANGQIVDRELIHHKPAVAVLAVTDEDKIVLVKQYRPAIDRAIYEIPAGILDKGDEQEPLEGARRELEEETAYQASHWRELHRFYVSPGFLDEEIVLFEASGLTVVNNPLPQDDDEDIELAEFTREQARALVAQGEIIDLKTLYAIQHWLTGGI